MRISSAVILFSTYPILTSIISVIFLKAKISKFEIFTYIICFFSLVIITKPAFIFKGNDLNEDQSFGVFLAFLSALFNSFGTILNQQIAYDFDVLISGLFYGLMFSLQSICLGIFSENFFNYSYMTVASFTMIILLGVNYFYSLIYFVEALNIGDPIKILPFTYIGMVFNIFYNCFFFGGSIDFLDIIGSIAIVFVNILNNFIQK